MSSDEAGILSFKVTLAAEPDRDTAVLAYLDTDKNAATGTPARFGADYQLAASQLSQTDATFSLRRWNGRTFVEVSSVYPDVELRGRVVTLGFANADRIAKSFRFAVETQRRPRVALDRAPDPEQAPLTFELSRSSPAELSLGELTLTPTRPRAGRVLTASMGVQAGQRADVMNSIEDFACSARVGPNSSGLSVRAASTASKGRRPRRFAVSGGSLLEQAESPLQGRSSSFFAADRPPRSSRQ